MSSISFLPKETINMILPKSWAACAYAIRVPTHAQSLWAQQRKYEPERSSVLLRTMVAHRDLPIK